MSKENSLPLAVENFDQAPNSMLVDLHVAGIIASRSRVSLYRDAKAGRLELVKIGRSTKTTVGSLRRLICAKAAA
ncbi:MAG: transcriptional regulator [Rhodocyclaceae bacterium]|nr:transcriptional regulator [Rhodocyclaceae bacterium]